ncbi:MAG: hypothetical protein IT456_26050, partial [Planctomycetes bacterium]|nr:hypothetical protein [Planctomycetota bacterium]
MKLILPLLLSAYAFAQGPVVTEKPVPAPTPKVEQSQDPKKQEPKPVGDKPVGDKPASDKPVGEKPEEPKIDRPAKEQPIPKGTDPADIAAMR